MICEDLNNDQSNLAEGGIARLYSAIQADESEPVDPPKVAAVLLHLPSPFVTTQPES